MTKEAWTPPHFREKLLLYAIIDPAALTSIPSIAYAKMLLDAGVRCFQLRQKVEDENLLPRAEAFTRLAKYYDALFFINDDAELAAKVGASGVHVGQGDMSVQEVRQRYPELLVGVSARSVELAQKGEAEGAAYVGCGPIWDAKVSKVDAAAPIGLQRLEEVCQSVSIPVVGIGGIRVENARSVMQAGAAGVAVIRALLPETLSSGWHSKRIEKRVEAFFKSLKVSQSG